MQNVLITGGAGFIGRNLIAHLAEQNDCDLTVFDDESLGKRDDIAGFDVRFIKASILDYDAVAAAVKGKDTVIHLAADTRVVDSIANPRRNFQINVEGSFNVLLAARDAGVETFVNASTGGAILGDATPPVHEDMVPLPAAPYGASKLAVEGYCSAFQHAFGMNTVSLRFSNVYGPGSSKKRSVVAEFFRCLLTGRDLIVYGEGDQVRDFIFVEDLCVGIISATTLGRSGVFQLGSGRPTTINELIDQIRNTVGQDVPVRVSYEKSRPGEVQATWCDISKAKDELGFNPVTTLDDGLQRTWDWFINHAGEFSANATGDEG